MAINKALFIEQLRRFWAIPALALVVLVVGVYMPLFNVTDWVFSSRLNNILTMRHFLMLLVMVLTPVAAAFCTFGMFFNKKTATAFYSMPINKTQILLTNALAGIVLSLTPMLVFSLLMLPYAGYAGSEVFWLLFMLSIGSVFYFAVAWLAFSLAGHGFVALCLMVVIPFVPISLVWATEAIGSLFVFGFAGLFDMDTQNLIFIYHTPAVWGQLFWDGVGGFERNVLFPAISYVVISLALFVAAFFISRARQVERTGDSVIFRPVKHVLIFLFSFMGMWFIGLIFFAFGRSTANMHVGLVVGFAISYMAAQMIAEKTFLIFGKLKYLPIYGGTAIGLYVFMLLFTQFGMGFYVNRIPSTANIYGVYVSNSFLHGGLSNEEWRLMAFTDAEAIESTRAAHRVILSERRRLHNVPFTERGSTHWVENVDGTFFIRENVHIKYFLTNGRIMTREYSITGDFIADTGFDEFLTSEHVLLADFPILRNPEEISHINLQFTRREQSIDGRAHADGEVLPAVMIFNRAQIAEILELVSQGVIENGRETRARRAANPLDFSRPDSEFWLNISIITHDHVQGDRQGWWRWTRQPHIFGEPVDRLHELVYGWGVWMDMD